MTKSCLAFSDIFTWGSRRAVDVNFLMLVWLAFCCMVCFIPPYICCWSNCCVPISPPKAGLALKAFNEFLWIQIFSFCCCVSRKIIFFSLLLEVKQLFGFFFLWLTLFLIVVEYLLHFQKTDHKRNLSLLNMSMLNLLVFFVKTE